MPVPEAQDPEEVGRRAGNLLFWSALLDRNGQEAQLHADRLLGVTPLISAFGFDDPEAPGEPKTGTVAADTPGHTVAAWNGEGSVRLFLVDADLHCVARVGRDGSDTDFTACVLPTRGVNKCTAVGHLDPKKRFGLSIAPGTKHVAIATRPETSAANKTVFCRPMVALQDIPPPAIDGGMLGRILEIVGPPRVLRVLLLGFEDGYLNWERGRGAGERRPSGGQAAAADRAGELEEVGRGGDETPGPPSADKAGRMRSAAWHGERARLGEAPMVLLEEFSATGRLSRRPAEAAATKPENLPAGLPKEEAAAAKEGRAKAVKLEAPPGEDKDRSAPRGLREREPDPAVGPRGRVVVKAGLDKDEQAPPGLRNSWTPSQVVWEPASPESKEDGLPSPITVQAEPPMRRAATGGPAAATRQGTARAAAQPGSEGSDSSASAASSSSWSSGERSKPSPGPSSAEDSVGVKSHDDAWCDEEYEDVPSSDGEAYHHGYPSRYDGWDPAEVEAAQGKAQKARYRQWVRKKGERRAAHPEWRDRRREAKEVPVTKDILASMAALTQQVARQQRQLDSHLKGEKRAKAALERMEQKAREYEVAAKRRAKEVEKRLKASELRAEVMADEAARSASEAAASAAAGGTAPTLTRRERKRLVRDVLVELDPSQFAREAQLRGFAKVADLHSPEPGTALHGLYAMRGLVDQHHRILLDPAGTFAAMEERITAAENKRMASAVEYGGVTFKDAQGTKAWFALLADKEAHTLCPDMVTILSTASTAANTISEGMTTAANAIRAHFDSVLAAETTFSFEVLYPELILSKTTATDAGGEMGGYKWSPGFATREAFKGAYQNGTEKKMRTDIQGAMRNYQTAIDGRYSAGSKPYKVFSEMAALAGSQALAFLDSVAPLADMLVTTGMSEKDAWERTALYPKALFDAIRLVRVTTLKGLTNQGGALVWGSMQTTALVAIYAMHNFIDHPKIASMLALSSMQKEGLTMKKLQVDFDRLSGQGAAMDKRIKALERK